MSSKTVAEVDGRCPECKSDDVREVPHATHGPSREAMSSMLCEECGWEGARSTLAGQDADDVRTVGSTKFGTYRVTNDAVDVEENLLVLDGRCPECGGPLEVHLGPARDWTPHELEAKGEMCQDFDVESGCTHTSYDHPALDSEG